MSVVSKRFWAKVEIGTPEDCWEWKAAKNDGGYGRLKVDGRQCIASRYAYSDRIGPIPPGKIVCHTCDNPGCVNPSHLFVGTHRDNTDDKLRKGRARAPRGEAAHGAKLSARDVADIREALAVGARGAVTRLAARYGVGKATISNIKTGRTWSAEQASPVAA